MKLLKTFVFVKILLFAKERNICRTHNYQYLVSPYCDCIAIILLHERNETLQNNCNEKSGQYIFNISLLH